MVSPEIPQHLIKHISIFICPFCGGELKISGKSIICKNHKRTYEIINGIPQFFEPNNWKSSSKDVTSEIQSFYEKSPFPDYDDIDNPSTLINKARKGIFADMLNTQIPFNIRVLDIGTGTGQLTNFLGIAQRHVFGIDMSLNSLLLAQNFKIKHNLKRVGFYQMNLFKPVFKEKSFPVVISMGVLHHTSDPFLAFQSISKLVSDNGYIIIGLYNKFGRITNEIRKLIFRLSGDRFKFLDPNLKNLNHNRTKKLSWFNDQYKNPHESKHTIDEVLKWFNKTGFEFVWGIPSLALSDNFSNKDLLFEPHKIGNRVDHLINQIKLIFTGSREGGYFLLIGKKTNKYN